MTDNPWSDIRPSDSSDELPARRADPGHPFNFWYSRDVRGRPMFLLQFRPSSRVALSLPNPKGLEVVEQSFLGKDLHQLVIVLREEGNVDLFHRLCLDLMDATHTSENEAAAVKTTIARLVRWQQLLQSGAKNSLEVNKQKGLIGELLFLRDMLVPECGVMSAVSFWAASADDEGSKDFSVGRAAVEVKTRTGTSPSRVLISSGEQLDPTGFERLYLSVYEISAASGNSAEAFTLHDLVRKVRVQIRNDDSFALEAFNNKLEARGFSDAHDYENRYVTLGVLHHEVQEGFPRIVQRDIPTGIIKLTYALDLAACRDFRIPPEKLADNLRKLS